MIKNCPWKKYHIACKGDCLEQKGSDPQKQRVYCWEETLNNKLRESDNMMSFEDCKKLVEKICSFYDVPVPEISEGKWKRKATGGELKITLPKKYRDRLSVIHEACHTVEQNHAVTHETYDNRQDHGPVFVRLEIDTISRELGIPVSKLIKNAKMFDLEIASAEEVKI